ncbi:hypothetical protein [Fibrobacter sp. UWR2]|uniref:hypothetical protein n=1 Tax=Fibrobacter sp. UWR2 TaxID=1964352 RepID=UPI000B524340|nr:hypothetical protein [Fibrobacter sp. UWR2]OWV00993.1 hypothetical protein B7994_04200 [Fibrobacter sp. UWR2]
MEIKKGKVLKDRDWSLKTQKNLASMLGITAALSLSGAALTACNEVVASGGDIEDADSSSSEQMTCGEMPCDGDIRPESSSSQTKFSSSIDPVGGISSSSIAPRPNSSSSEDPPLSAGILPPSSSSYEIDTLEVTSGEVIPPEIVGPESGCNIDTGHLESSSSIAEPSSSSYQRIESSSATSGLPLSSWEEVPPSSSSAETEPLPGEPIELDDPKD